MLNKYIQQLLDDNNLKENEKFKIVSKSTNCPILDGLYFEDGILKKDGTECFQCWLSMVMNDKYQIVKLPSIPTERFTPRNNERYYFVTPGGTISYLTYSNDYYDEYVVQHTLCFETKEQAEDYKWFLDKIDEYKKPFVIFESNSYVYYDRENEEIGIYFNDAHQVQGVIYFGSGDNANAFIEEVGEERIKKYMFDIWE